ncbi:unnamed protein product [Darwinula stevensoni]|uniref:type I protein arginine methyltransferase n=1 Tax=Darwinula stevensoni TaxID=69355 RepID=A0A7R8XIN8_9CRUS|nr:unnamed protein product [Darwinula stevensoni]CAG0894019.1 unnamed protein product [Darwinula stevensoni]
MNPGDYNLKWNSHNSETCQAFSSLRNDGIHVDTVLSSGLKNIKVHKLVLCAGSKYFERMFQLNNQFSSPTTVFHFHGIPFNLLEWIIDYIYTGEVILPQESLMDFLALAESLEVKGLLGSLEKTKCGLPGAKRSKMSRPKFDISASSAVRTAAISSVQGQEDHVMQDDFSFITNQELSLSDSSGTPIEEVLPELSEEQRRRHLQREQKEAGTSDLPKDETAYPEPEFFIEEPAQDTNFSEENMQSGIEEAGILPFMEGDKTFYKCIWCEYVCGNKFAAVSHSRVHTDCRPFTCPICEKKFKLKHHLQRHVINVHTEQLQEILVSKSSEVVTVGACGILFSSAAETLLLKFCSNTDQKTAWSRLQEVRNGQVRSVFSTRTDESSASQYFQFYGYLSQQQNMMQDYVRTSTYQKAMLSNAADFKGKVVLDVGAGSGILSFFAIQAGAHRVYAVEASSMAKHAQELVKANKLGDKIIVIAGKIEEIDLPEEVDVIISEPMGYMLYNERMLETYLHAKKWLKRGGKMFPTRGDLHVAPFTDDAIYMEQFNKANFWYQQNFHGVDLCSLRQAAMNEYFRQPIVDTFDIRICMSKSVRYTIDFQTANETDLHVIEIPLEFHLLQSGTVHGLAFWFEVVFLGSSQPVWLSTAPTEPLTHWYQVRCLLETPIFVKVGQLLTGKVTLTANERQSYDVNMNLNVEGTGTQSSNTLDLKNPYFRYTGQPQTPPGHNTTSPSESYWQQLDAQGARQGQSSLLLSVNLVNGISVNGLGEINMDASHLVGQLVDGTGGSLGGHAAVHPGGILSTGQGKSNSGSLGTPNRACPTASSASQLIGGAVSPSSFSQASQVVMGTTSHYPVSNSLMIGDYVTSGALFLPPQNYHIK